MYVVCDSEVAMLPPVIQASIDALIPSNSKHIYLQSTNKKEKAMIHERKGF